MQESIKEVYFNNNVIRALRKKSWADRLGMLVTFVLVEHPNESISYYRTLDWFKHILAVCGYTYEHIKDLRGGEMCECFIDPACDYNLMVVRHKYLSLKTCLTIKYILKEFCKLNKIPWRIVYR